MSRILRRPMFRGGKVSSYGTGIASGLADGGRPGYKDGRQVLDVYEGIKEQIPERDTQGLTTGDYLRIASAGLDILGRPAERGGISGALAAASQPLAKLGVDLGSSIDTRRAKALEGREELARTLTGAEVERQIGMEKAKGVAGFIEKKINELFNPDIEAAIAAGDKETAETLKKQKQNYIRDYIIRGQDDSDFLAILRNPTALDQAEGDARRIVKSRINPATGANWTDNDKGFTALKNKEKFRILRETSKFNVEIETKAEGGLTGMMTEDVNVMEQTPSGIADVNIQETETMDPNNPQPMQVSYDELRARLPKEIGDEIVTLLANSYEALADFAAISTQADVDNFNVKYGVELVLPQEA
jgi:hypothetical protein